MKWLIRGAGVLTVLSFLVISSSTVIRTDDPQAKIFIDGEYGGIGSAVASDWKILGSITNIRIEKDGCEPAYYTFTRNERFDLGASLAGMVAVVPFLWALKYKPEHTYSYQCLGGGRGL